jgi:glycosyltransferase involved in cell wall biosynthesis
VSEIEIIFVDDSSTDNSVKVINEFSKNDKRIKLIKNKINKGTLYSRSQGALLSKGEYIIFIDSDYLILREGLYNSYNYIKKKDLSMIQFNTIFKRNDTYELTIRYYKYEKIINQPILSNIFYYNELTKKADELNTALWDKLINREIAVKAVDFIGKEYYNEYIPIENDVILLFSIFQMAKSYQYINETGYFYIRTHNDSITNSWKIPKIASSVVHGLFVNIKFLYEKSNNNSISKLFSIFKLRQSFIRYIICFKKAEKEYEFIKNALEKQIPKKPIRVGYCICPNCNEELYTEVYDPSYCENCGQALDWSKENE